MIESSIIVEPTDSHLYSVIWLHGLGASADDFYSLLPALSFESKSSFRWIFPNAIAHPVTINGGISMPSWFDIFSLAPDFSVNEQHVEKTCKEVLTLLQSEVNSLFNPTSELFLIGFSQGGVIALHAGILAVAHGVVKKLSILGLSCCHPFLGQMLKGLSAIQLDRVKKSVRIVLMHGEYDEIIGVDLSKESRDFLHAFAIPVELKIYSMAHQVCSEQINDISNFF